MTQHEQSKTWKYFEKNELTHSAAHYLMTIHELKEKDGYARLSDVAAHMDITAGSCSITLGKLKEKGLIKDDKKKFYHLTEVGDELIQQVIKNEAVFQQFFHEVLGVDKWQSEIDACKIEHLISPDTSEALCQFLRFLGSQGLLADSFLQSFKKFQGGDHQCQDCKDCQKDCALKA